jgi:hypothetical protein
LVYYCKRTRECAEDGYTKTFEEVEVSNDENCTMISKRNGLDAAAAYHTHTHELENWWLTNKLSSLSSDDDDEHKDYAKHNSIWILKAHGRESVRECESESVVVATTYTTRQRENEVCIGRLGRYA